MMIKKNVMEYRELKNGISAHLNSAAEDFFLVGHCLRQISERALFLEDGYKSIWDFAKAEYGLSISSTSRFMAINARFSPDDGEHMDEKYIGMGVSKLQEMLGLSDEELEKVTQETTVREIRAMKKRQQEPLSFFGLPKTVRPEGSLITTVGCGNGEHDCFACCRDCGIRQEERYCRTATTGNPFPCKQMGDSFKQHMQHSLYRKECQILHPELAPVREGDKEPDPCCLICTAKICFFRCDVAKKRDEEERRAAEAAKRQEEREHEAARPEPTDRDIKAFFDWEGFKRTETITADGLKQKFRNAAGGDSKFDYQGSTRGIRINYKKEITWVQAAKRLKEIQEKERGAAETEARSVSGVPDALPKGKEAEIIDVICKEIEEEPVPEPEKILCESCRHKGECSGKKTHKDDCLGYEEQPETESAEETPDPESYTICDIRDVLRECEADLKEYRELGGLPEKMMKKQRILTDALQLLYDTIRSEEDEE